MSGSRLDPAAERLRRSRWRVLGELGVGAGGPVHAVRHLDTGTLGAMKVAQDAFGRERMRAEVQALHEVRHPCLVRLLDSGEDEAGSWLVLERLEGTAAASLAGGEAMPERDVSALARDVLGALEALHAAGVVHRDVKPSNILRASDGSWRLADLGSAHLPGSDLTLTGTVLGTAAYMAPEQRHTARKVGPSADLYALGATLWALLRAETPFELHADDPAAWSGLPLGLTRVIRGATRLQPADRWSSAREMAQQLPVATRPSGSGTVRVALVVAVLSVGGLTLWKGQRWSTPLEGVWLRVRVTGTRPGDSLGASLASGVNVSRGAGEELLVGSPGEHLGGIVRAYEDRCCDEEQVYGTTLPGLRYGEALGLVRHGAGVVLGGWASTGNEGGVAGSGQVFFKPTMRSVYGSLLHLERPYPFGEAGISLAAWFSEGASRVAYGAPGATPAAGSEHAGAVLVVPGERPGTLLLVEGSERGARLGAAVSVADLDGDGQEDVFAGAPGALGGAGCAWAFLAIPKTPSRPEARSLSEAALLGCGAPGEAFGSALVPAGDTDGDGFEEVWIGAPGGDRALRVDLGGVRAQVRGERPGDGFGAVLHARRDLPGVLWVGAPAAREGRGAVWGFAELGEDAYDTSVAEASFVGAEPGGHFGAALALHRDSAGAYTLLVGAPGEDGGRGRLWGG